MSSAVGRRRGLDLALLWLWRRPAATAPIRPLAWEPPCATGVALEKAKKKKKRNRKTNTSGWDQIEQQLPWQLWHIRASHHDECVMGLRQLPWSPDSSLRVSASLLLALIMKRIPPSVCKITSISSLPSLTHLFWPSAALNIHITIEYLTLQCSIFFLLHFDELCAYLT